MNKYFISAPPPPIYLSKTSNSTQISYSWINPTQLTFGFIDKLLPYIQSIVIKYKNNTTTSWSKYTCNYASNITGVRITYSNGTNSLQSNIICIYAFYTPIDLNIYFTNYNGESNGLSESGMTFTTASAPSIPIAITLNTITSASVRYTITPGQYTDATTQETSAGPGAPTIKNYVVTYTPISNTTRYLNCYNNDPKTTETTETTSNNNLTSLYPDTMYSIGVYATNSANKSSGISPLSTFMTSGLTAPNNSVILTIPTYYSLTVYFATSSGSATSINNVLCNSVNSTGTSAYFPLMTFDTRGSTGSSICTVTSTIDSRNPSSIVYNGFNNTTKYNITNGNDITLSVGNDPIDYYLNENAGFYLKCNFNYMINSGLPCSTTAYTLTTRFSSSNYTTSTTSTNFYVDGLTSAPPTLDSVSITNISSYIYITGVPIVTTWMLNISNLTGTNIIYNFSALDAVTYTFANTSSQVLLKYLIPSASLNNTLIGSTPLIVFSTPTSISNSSNIIISAKNINNVSASITTPMKLFFDPKSIPFANINLIDSPVLYITLNTDLSTIIPTYDTVVLQSLNHNISLINTTNLQIVNGRFVTKNAVNAYQDYTSYATPPQGFVYSDYSVIQSHAYRWATFKFTSTASLMTKLQIIVGGFSGTQPYLSTSAPYIRNVIVLYRLENPAVPKPENKQTSSTYSTVWINAAYVVDPAIQFTTTYSLTANTLTYGGLVAYRDLVYSDGTLTINNLTYPAQQSINMNIYVSIGLLMSNDISFSSVSCNTI
jgi:hypothetical protein